MKAYITHYTPLIERKPMIQHECEVAGLEAYFIESYDRDVLTEEMKAKFACTLSDSKKSLILKHIEAWRQIVESENPWGLVLEDDALLIPKFLSIFKKYMEELPTNFDIFMINYGCELHIPPTRIEENQHVYKRGTEPTYWGGDGGTRCTEGYVISRDCAKKFLDIYEKSPNNSIEKPVDWWMNIMLRELNCDVYWAEPPIVRQGSLWGLVQRSLHE